MNAFTATNKTQGVRENDFCWTVEGELVVFPPIECDCGTIDDGCGCKRAMAGLASHRATTTVEVTDRQDLTCKEYGTLIIDGLKSQGYLDDELLKDPEVQEWAELTVDELVHLAGRFAPGTVLERRGNHLQVRCAPSRPTARGS